MRLNIINKHNNEIYPGILHPLLPSDIPSIDPKHWTFDWTKEISNPDHHTYKLLIRGDTQIQGLISFEEIDEGEGYIYVRYLESASGNRGRNGEFRIAPALLAYACKRSYDKGYDGFVCIYIKIDKALIRYYKSLGAEFIGNQRMILDSFASRRLIQLYLNKGV